MTRFLLPGEIKTLAGAWVVETGGAGLTMKKLQITIESLQTPIIDRKTARHSGISRSLLTRWQRSFCPEPNPFEVHRVRFAPVIVAAGAVPVVATAAGRGPGGGVDHAPC